MKVNLTISIPVWLDRICAWPVMVYRKYKYGWPFRRIYLGEGEWTILDAVDYYRFGNFKWSVAGHDGKFYAVSGLKTSRKEMKIMRLHRIICNAPKGLLVDHKNSNSLDNRRSNLRLATRSQNNCNSRIDKSKTSSRLRGVTLKRQSGRWIAQIEHRGKNHYLGSFDNELDAARAYDAAARKYHGEFACLNFPD